MEQLGGGDGPIDIHEYRHGLKLRKETRETSLWTNEAGYACPACGEAFTGLFTSEKRHNTFSPTGDTAFCLVREADRILMFRH
jgi:transposase-like protein